MKAMRKASIGTVPAVYVVPLPPNPVPTIVRSGTEW